MLPTFDERGRIVWVARPDRDVDAPDTDACLGWRPASGIAQFDVFRIESSCLYRVPTVPTRPISWWLALDGEPVSQDFEMIGKVVLDGNRLLVITVPVGGALSFETPPMELDDRTPTAIRSSIRCQRQVLRRSSSGGLRHARR